MNEKKEHIVVLLDVLGFKNLFEKVGLEVIVSKYKELIQVAEEHNYEFGITEGPGGHPIAGNPGIKSAYFSDSLIFWCPYNPFSMQIMFDSLREILCKSIEIGLPLRGCVSVGEVEIDKEAGVYIGIPIIEAANGETMQDWIGITLSKKFDFTPYNGGFKADMILEYKEHFKTNWEEFLIPLAIDFPRKWRETRTSSLYDAVNNLNTEKAFSKKYDNTINFVNYSEQNHDWWKKYPGFKAELERMKKIEDEKKVSR